MHLLWYYNGFSCFQLILYKPSNLHNNYVIVQHLVYFLYIGLNKAELDKVVEIWIISQLGFDEVIFLQDIALV